MLLINLIFTRPVYKQYLGLVQVTEVVELQHLAVSELYPSNTEYETGILPGWDASALFYLPK